MKFFLRNQNLFTAAGLFCTGLLLFTFGLAQQEIIGFESRFYLFALEMWRHGVSWFPTTYGDYYPDYPVTATLLIDAAAHLTGRLNKFSAILPSAIAAALTLSITYLIGTLHHPRWGWYAVFFLLLTNTFFMEARTISPDQYIGMLTALAFYLVDRSALLRQRAPFWGIIFIFAAGFAVRGPIGLVVPAGVICIYYLLENNFRQFWKAGFTAVAILLVCSVVLLSVAAHVGNLAFVKEVLRMQVYGRLGKLAPVPWYFYFYESLGAYALTYPLAILVLLGLRQKAVANDLRPLLKFAGWAAVVIIGLTIPSGKKIRYILAAAPALSLLAAYIFIAPRQVYFLILRRVVLGIFICLPLACFLALIFLLRHNPQNNFLELLPYGKLLFAFGGLFVLSFLYRKQTEIASAIAASAFMLAYIAVAEPVNLELNKTHAFVAQVEAARLQQHAVLVFYQQSRDTLPIKYLINMNHEEEPLFFSTPEDIAHQQQPVYFIITPQFAAALPKDTASKLKEIYAGQLGHDKVSVFIKL
jgi:4-amino-4-deoxy-L-arabinose transferase-like glycosyltransferase